MGKSLASQVRGAWAASGILVAGGSRYARKQAARDELRAQGVGATSARIAALTPVTSYRTYDAYKAVSVDFARFAQSLGVKRLQDLRPEHAEAFLLIKLKCGRSCNTLRTCAAALGKLDRVLALAPAKMNIPEHARILPGVDAMRKRINREAPRLDQMRRAYFHPEAVVQMVQGEAQQLAARLQLVGGFRVSEVMGLSTASLQGEAIDPVLGRLSGVVHVVGKGGYEREQFIPLSVYRELRAHLAEHGGRFGLSYKPYLAALHRACNAVGEEWSGTHALRHSYVRGFVVDAVAVGLKADAVRREAMERVGHHRTSELKTYCR